MRKMFRSGWFWIFVILVFWVVWREANWPGSTRKLFGNLTGD